MSTEFAPEIRAKTDPFRKPGVNFSDRAAIKKLAEQGYDAEFIAGKIGVRVAVVKKFMPQNSPTLDPAAPTDEDIEELIGADIKPVTKPARKKVVKKKSVQKVA